MSDAHTSRVLQPSASRTGLLLECSYAFSQKCSGSGPGDRESANYGSAFHELLAEIIFGGWGWPTDKRIMQAVAAWGLAPEIATELHDHLAEAAPALRRWLEGANPFRCNFLANRATVLVEKSYALHDKDRRGDGRVTARPTWPYGAREIAGPTLDEHVYEELQPGELAGTADLVIIPPKGSRGVPLLVLDHKTGQEEFYEPLSKPQLISLARAASLAHGTPKAGVVVGVLHARRRGMPAVYADLVPDELLESHTHRVFLSLARVGDGSMRPGPWCMSERCPAQDVCPARDAQLLKNAGGLLEGLIEFAQAGNPNGDVATTSEALAATAPAGLSRDKRLGALYAVVQQAEKLAEASRREIRTEVLAGALPELPGGGTLTIKEYPKENLSKASIVRAYGKLAGEKLLKKLRRDGAIETTPVVSLRVEGEKGT